MKTQSIDTNSKTEKFLISLLRNASTEKKISLVRSLSQTIIQLSKRAISRANKNLDKQQIDLRFITYHYGIDLANRVKKYLDKSRHENS